MVGADHHLFWVGVEDWGRFAWGTHSPIGGILAALPERCGTYVFTKVHTGLVGVEVNYHESRPELDFDSWEDADLVVVDAPLGDLCVLPIGGYGDVLQEIVPGPGAYSVCCSSRGRDEAEEAEYADPPVEFYRFDVWPAGPADADGVLKQTSAWSREVLETFG